MKAGGTILIAKLRVRVRYRATGEQAKSILHRLHAFFRSDRSSR